MYHALYTNAQKTPYADPVLDRCWANVADGGPISKQYCVRVSRLPDDQANTCQPNATKHEKNMLLDRLACQ